MNSIIEYQEIEKRLKKIESDLRNSEEWKKAKNAKVFLLSSDERVKRLDQRASELVSQYVDIKKVYSQRLSQAEQFYNIATELEEHKEVDFIAKKAEKAFNDVKRLESELLELTKNIDAILKEFADLRNKIKVAKQELAINKDAYDKIKVQKDDEIVAFKKQLLNLQKSIDKNELEAYRKKIESGIFPVYVKFNGGNQCPGCGMELPLSQVNEIGVKNQIECEECKRIITKVE